jgi:predicted nucleic acid-binding protein
VVLAVVDTGPLYAVADRSDLDHARSLAVLQRRDLELVIPALAVAEVCYLLAERLGAAVEAAFLRGLARFNVQPPHPDDWARIADLVQRYASFPLGGVDASVVALAERLGTDLVVTLDERHFRAIRPQHCAAFRLLPEPEG